MVLLFSQATCAGCPGLVQLSCRPPFLPSRLQQTLASSLDTEPYAEQAPGLSQHTGAKPYVCNSRANLDPLVCCSCFLCAPQNLHGMPGLLGGFIAGIAAFGQAAGVAPHGKAQIGFQLLSLLCTVAIASTGGALVSALATGGRAHTAGWNGGGCSWQQQQQCAAGPCMGSAYAVG